MNKAKKTTVNNTSKITSILIILAWIAVFGVLATNNICSNCSSNLPADFIGNSDANGDQLIMDINADNFNTIVAKRVVLVDFRAPWCHARKAQEIIFGILGR